MEEDKKTIICHFCNKENDLDSKYCSACGKPTKPESENQSEKEPVICPHCNTELQSDDKFCTECGTNISEANIDKEIICPNCNLNLPPGTKFCKECGTELAQNIIKCPKCDTELDNKQEICTNCGETIPPSSALINEKLRQKKIKGELKKPPKDENVDNAIGFSLDIVQGVGGIFNNAVKEVGNLTGIKKNSNEKKKPKIKPRENKEKNS